MDGKGARAIEGCIALTGLDDWKDTSGLEGKLRAWAFCSPEVLKHTRHNLMGYYCACTNGNCWTVTLAGRQHGNRHCFQMGRHAT